LFVWLCSEVCLFGCEVIVCLFVWLFGCEVKFVCFVCLTNKQTSSQTKLHAAKQRKKSSTRLKTGEDGRTTPLYQSHKTRTQEGSAGGRNRASTTLLCRQSC
jgi:hypothetical protein